MSKPSIVLPFLMAASLEAAIDFESSVPANWNESGNGSLAISSNHFRLGTESLAWSWEAGDILTASNVSIDPSKILDFHHHTLDFWLYSDTVTPNEPLTIEFLDEADEVQFRFQVLLNYQGWRHLLRSYRYDMENLGGGTSLETVRFIAPASGSGQLFLDDITWVRNRQPRWRDRAMPDVGNYFSKTLHHDLDELGQIHDPATPAELAALSRIESEFLDEIDSSDPGSGTVNNAKADYLSWNITKSGNNIKGNPIDRTNVDDIDDFLYILAREWYHDNDTEARDMALLTIEHLLDQGWAGGSAESTDGGAATYGTRDLIRALLLLAPDLSPTLRAQVKDLLRWRLKPGFAHDPNLATNKNTDYIHTESQGLLGTALFYADSEQEKVEGLRELRLYLERFLEQSVGTNNGIHADGTSFHHWTHYNHYMYAFGQMSERLYKLRDSPFMISREPYERFRESVYVMALMCNEVDYARSLSGRNPDTPGLPVSESSMARLAKAGGTFYGQSADPKIARLHNRIWNSDSILRPYDAEAFPTGFWQFNYSPMGLFRTRDTVATIKGFTDTFWGTEIYSTANRYGRYQSYGAIDLMSPGGRSNSGSQARGWNWNCPPGTTTIVLPFDDLEASKGRQDEVAQTRFCGALSANLSPGGEFRIKGDLGLFGMKFRQANLSPTHNPSFTFRKSVFAFDNKLLCLGSDISNDDSGNETVTTLFQASLPSTTTATNHEGTDITSFPGSTTWSSGQKWFLDHLGNGYYLPGSQNLRLTRENQTSPSQSGNGSTTSDDFATLLITHGNAPAGEDYEYLIFPNTTETEVAAFAATTLPYTIHQKNSEAHIVELPEQTHGYVCFEDGILTHGPVTEVSAPAFLWTQRNDNFLTLSYANPELDLAFRELTPAGLVTCDVTLDGTFLLETTDPRAQVLATTANSTTIRFQTEHGLPVELELLEVTTFATWQSQHFTPAQLADTTISGFGATPAGDSMPNALKYAYNLSPFTPTFENPNLTYHFSGPEFTVRYRNDRSRSDITFSLEHSTSLTDWSPLSTTLDSENGTLQEFLTTISASEASLFIRLAASRND